MKVVSAERDCGAARGSASCCGVAIGRLGVCDFVSSSPAFVFLFLRFVGCFFFLCLSVAQDEIFHVPQTQRYCLGEWLSWDPKITTFPGSYAFAWLVAQAVRAFEMAAARLPGGWRGGEGVDGLGAAGAPLGVAGGASDSRGRSFVDGSFASFSPPSSSSSIEPWCGVPVLRAAPALLAVGCALLVAASPRSGRSPATSLLRSLVVLLFPPFFFYASLAYTDASALFWLLCARAALWRGQGGASALASPPPPRAVWGGLAGLCSALAIFSRQTNAVWVAFLVGEAALEDWKRSQQREAGGETVIAAGKGIWKGAGVEMPALGRTSAAAIASGDARSSLSTESRQTASRTGREVQSSARGLSRRFSPRSRSGPAAPTRTSSPFAFLSPVSDASSLLARLARSPSAAGQLFLLLGPSTLPLLAFGAFLVWNGGDVVIGDRSNHRVARHWAQLGYLGLALLATVWPCAFALASAFRTRQPSTHRRRTARSALGAFALLSGLLSAALARGAIAHPFLLSDNRHHTSTLWRRALSKRGVRAALGPAAALGFLLAAAALRSGREERAEGSEEETEADRSCSDSSASSNAAGRSERKTWPGNVPALSPPQISRSIPLAPGLSLWWLGFAAACVLSLVPSPLLEPRYLIPPVALLVASIADRTGPGPTRGGAAAKAAALTASAAAFAAVDALALFVFLKRPYVWDDGSVARKVW